MRQKLLKDPMLKMGVMKKPSHFIRLLGDLLWPGVPFCKSSCIRFLTKLAKDLPARLRL